MEEGIFNRTWREYKEANMALSEAAATFHQDIYLKDNQKSMLDALWGAKQALDNLMLFYSPYIPYTEEGQTIDN